MVDTLDKLCARKRVSSEMGLPNETPGLGSCIGVWFRVSVCFNSWLVSLDMRAQISLVTADFCFPFVVFSVCCRVLLRPV